MNKFIAQNSEIFYSLVAVIILLLLRFGINKAIRRIGKINDYNRARTKLMIKYFNIILLLVISLVLSIIWGVDFKELGVILSSIFAVVGIALFAQWSIISNITSGMLLFFSFPFKIGDKIKIQDKDFPTEAIIEDIKAFNVNLRTDEGELITYPNSLFLQKAIMVLNDDSNDDGKESV